MPRRRPHSSAQIGDIRIGHAAHPRKAGPALHIDVDGLRLEHARVVPLPEPVDVTVLNGRQPEPWEEDEIRAARERERRAQMLLLPRAVTP